MYNSGFVCCIKINGKSVEEKDGKAILPFNSEYSIMLKNRNDRKAVAKVFIDGEDVTKTGKLILDANTSINLERYVEDMNNGRRFKFVPLSDDKVHDKKDGERGFIEVRFQLVKPTQTQVIVHEEHIWHNHHHHNDWWDKPVYKGPFYYDGSLGGNGFIGFCSNGTSNTSGKGLSCNFTSDKNNSYLSSKVEGNKLIEEGGATVKGSNSSQKFVYSYVGELEANETVIRFKLIGTRDEAVVKEFTKTHCSGCGKRFDTKDKFCSNCGEKK